MLNSKEILPNTCNQKRRNSKYSTRGNCFSNRTNSTCKIFFKYRALENSQNSHTNYCSGIGSGNSHTCLQSKICISCTKDHAHNESNYECTNGKFRHIGIRRNERNEGFLLCHKDLLQGC